VRELNRHICTPGTVTVYRFALSKVAVALSSEKTISISSDNAFDVSAVVSLDLKIYMPNSVPSVHIEEETLHGDEERPRKLGYGEMDTAR